MANDGWPRSGPLNQVEVSFFDFNKRESVRIDPNRLGILGEVQCNMT